jgi:hypothetical protein
VSATVPQSGIRCIRVHQRYWLPATGYHTLICCAPASRVCSGSGCTVPPAVLPATCCAPPCCGFLFHWCSVSSCWLCLFVLLLCLPARFCRASVRPGQALLCLVVFFGCVSLCSLAVLHLSRPAQPCRVSPCSGSTGCLLCSACALLCLLVPVRLPLCLIVSGCVTYTLDTLSLILPYSRSDPWFPYYWLVGRLVTA